jgi:exodeoxyribonuclease VII small subunit
MPKMNYKELQNKLDVLMAKLENGEVGIDEALQCYEDGLKIIEQLEQYLQSAENRVHELKATYHLDG